MNKTNKDKAGRFQKLMQLRYEAEKEKDYKKSRYYMGLMNKLIPHTEYYLGNTEK